MSVSNVGENSVQAARPTSWWWSSGIVEPKFECWWVEQRGDWGWLPDNPITASSAGHQAEYTAHSCTVDQLHERDGYNHWSTEN